MLSEEFHPHQTDNAQSTLLPTCPMLPQASAGRLEKFSSLITGRHKEDDGRCHSTKSDPKTPATATSQSVLQRLRCWSGRRWSTDVY